MALITKVPSPSLQSSFDSLNRKRMVIFRWHASLAEAFIDLITGLCTGKQACRLEIRSLNGAPLDALSRDVAEVLQKKCSHKLVIL